MIPSKPTALITGASWGIGAELAGLFAAGGGDLVLVARSEDKLKAIARQLQAAHGISVHMLVKDLARPEAPEEIFSELTRTNISVDVLVNNAGFGSYGLFAASDPVRDLEMIAVNITALTHLTRLFLPELIRKKSGGILNVASTAGFQPGPLMAEYYATKAYVISLTEALANELNGTGVTASVLCPGPTATEFQTRAGLKDSPLFASGVMSAEAVARFAYRNFFKGKTTIVPGFKNRILLQIERFAPRALTPRIVRAMQESRTAI